MSAYDHILVLLSFVYALALTHVLSRIGGLLLARDRVRFSGLQALAMLNAMAQAIENWLLARATHGVSVWGLGDIVASFGFVVTNYLVCAAVVPDVAADGEIDLNAFYARNRRLIWGLYVLMYLSALLADTAFLKLADKRLFVQATLWTLPFFAPPLLAIAVKARWAQWAASLGLLALSIVWAILFISEVR